MSVNIYILKTFYTTNCKLKNIFEANYKTFTEQVIGHKTLHLFTINYKTFDYIIIIILFDY